MLRGRRPSYRDALLMLRERLNVHCGASLPTADLETEVFLAVAQVLFGGFCIVADTRCINSGMWIWWKGWTQTLPQQLPTWFAVTGWLASGMLANEKVSQHQTCLLHTSTPCYITISAGRLLQRESSLGVV